jgi:integrase
LVNGKRQTVYGDTEGELRSAMTNARAKDGTSEREVPTLGAWLEEWLGEYTSDDVTDNTLSNYRWAIDKWDALSDVYLDDLTVRTVNRQLQTMSSAGLSRSSLERARTVLAMALDQWNDDEQWSFNPARRATIPKRAKAKVERRTLTTGQARDLLSVTGDDRHGIAVDLMLWLGMRPGEVCGLRWDAIDLDAGTLNVVQFRRVDFDTGEISYAPPKAHSDRPLGLPAPLVDALRARWRQQVADRLAAPAGVWEDSGLVVTTNMGTPVDPANLRRTVRRLARSVGIYTAKTERDLTPYELRHTASSLLVESGMALEEVADLLGNDVRTLIANYRHRSRRLRSEHVAVTERLYA